MQIRAVLISEIYSKAMRRAAGIAAPSSSSVSVEDENESDKNNKKGDDEEDASLGKIVTLMSVGKSTPTPQNLATSVVLFVLLILLHRHRTYHGLCLLHPRPVAPLPPLNHPRLRRPLPNPRLVVSRRTLCYPPPRPAHLAPWHVDQPSPRNAHGVHGQAGLRYQRSAQRYPYHQVFRMGGPIYSQDSRGAGCGVGSFV
jgi:hypothetical protein